MTSWKVTIGILIFGLTGWLAACAGVPQQAPAAPAAAAPTAPAAQPAKPAAPPAAAAAQSARQVTNLRMMLGPFGTGTYTLGFALSELARKNHPWLRLSAGETPGFIYNIKAIENPSLWDNTITGTTFNTLRLAERGDPSVGQQVTGMRGLFTYLIVSNYLATLDSNIRTPADLKGKRIALGQKSQIGYGFLAGLALEHGFGITEANTKIDYVGTAPAKTMLMDGRADAAITAIYLNPFTKTYIPAPQLVEMVSGPRPVYHIPWGTQPVEETAKKTGLPFFQLTIPAGTMPTMKEDLQVYGDVAPFVAKDVFPEEYAYEIAKLVAQQVGKFAEYEALETKLISFEMLPYGWTTKTMHPGALRAYQELGLKVPEK